MNDENNPSNAATGDESIPDASEQTSVPFIPPLVIGNPFAMTEECDLVTAAEHRGANTRITIRCTSGEEEECGQLFNIDLAAAGAKDCPKCRSTFTHMLLVTAASDTGMVAAAMAQVLENNGIDPGALGLGGDDEDDDDDGEPK